MIDDVETPVPGLVPPSDLPLPASPARRGPGCAPRRGATRRPAPGDRGHGIFGPHRLRPVRLPLDRRASRHPPGAPAAAWSIRNGAGIPGDPTRALWRVSTPSCISPGRPSPAASPTPTSGWCATAGSAPPRSWPVSWPLCRTGRGSCSAPRPSATTGAERGDELLTEDSTRGSGFLAELVEAWEAAAQPAADAGVRVVHVRTGIVQSARGASLKLLRPLFSLGLGGPLAPGSQWVSWIGLDDLLDVFGRALADDELVGPAERGRALCRHQRRHTPRRWLGSCGGRRASRSLPSALRFSWAPRARARWSRRVSASLPARLAAAGHVFRHPSLEVCLRHQLGHIDVAPFGEESGNA